MQKPDVRHRFGDDLSVELEDEPQDAVSGRMRRPHVENHFLTDVVIGFPQLRFLRGNSRYRIGRFNFANGKCHRLVLSSVEWIDNCIYARDSISWCKRKLARDYWRRP